MAVKVNKNHIKWINENKDMKTLLEESGTHISFSGKLFCPFHHNVNTPSAKYYKDSNQIRCFSETMTYKPYDVLVKIQRKTLDQILDLIPRSLWYNCNLADTDVSFKVPVVKRVPEDFSTYIDYMYYLDQLWYNMDKVECRPL